MLKIKYNDEQLKFINSPLENSKLLGIPGGGKTASIIGKVTHHYNNKEIKLNEFCILTFSRRACSDFIEKGIKQNKKIFTPKNIRTIHSMAGRIISQLKDVRNSTKETVIVSCLSFLEHGIINITKIEEVKNLKVIFVDEAQDISEVQYNLIMKISSLTGAVVIMIGDPNQNIYQFQNSSDKYLLNHDGPVYYLIKNYRSSPRLVNFINEFRPWADLTPRMISTKEMNDNDVLNKKPIVFIGSVDEIIKDVLTKIQNSPFKREDIAIIGPVKKSKQIYDTYTNIGLSLFTNMLSYLNIPFVKHYDDNNSDEEVALDAIRRTEGAINIFTIHGSKGLEFNQVFLLNFHTNTFGMTPSQERYKEFKYLWYVGLSRAAYDLNIYVDKVKTPWDELKRCDSTLFHYKNKKLANFNKDLKFQDEIEPVNYKVIDMLNNKKMVDENTLFLLDDLFKLNIEEVNMFSETELWSDTPVINYPEFQKLYNIFIENIVSFKLKGSNALFINNIYKMIKNRVLVPKEHINGYKLLRIRVPCNKLIKLSDFHDIKNMLGKSEEDFYNYLCTVIGDNYNTEFYIDIDENGETYPKEEIIKSIKYLKGGKGMDLKIILNLTLFMYQLENESSYLWRYDFTNILATLQPYINNIVNYIELFKENEFEFSKFVKHPSLDLIGKIDLLNKSSNTIINIKFSNTISIKEIYNIVINNFIIGGGHNMEIWNFMTGVRFIIKLGAVDNYSLMKLLAKSIKRKINNIIFFYDLKTTGGNYAGGKVDIIDRYFEDYNYGVVHSSGLLKPIMVPFIPFDVVKATGITKDLMDEEGKPYETFVKEMKQIFELYENPIFISVTDHRILASKNLINMDKCKILDAKMIIRMFIENKEISTKEIKEIYEYFFRKTIKTNRAEMEVKVIIEIFKFLNITDEMILRMVNL